MEEEKKKSKFKIQRVHILIVVFLLLMAYLIAIIHHESVETSKDLQEMDFTNYRNQPYNDFGAPVVYYRSDLERDVGVRLEEKESKLAGISCKEYRNTKSDPTDFDSMTFYIFKDGKTASKAFAKVKESFFSKITDEGANHVQGWLSGVCDADVESYYYINGNLIIEADITVVGGFETDKEEEIQTENVTDPQNLRKLIIGTFGTREDYEAMTANPFALMSDIKVGRDVLTDDISEFYYTYENINYDAFYQRYRFYIEDGKHMFFHETRERPGEYGPADENDTTSIGTIELSDEQWSEFYDLVCGGVITGREDSAESGDSGPWLYLYWNGDKSEYQVFEFESYSKEIEFEQFCQQLAGD